MGALTKYASLSVLVVDDNEHMLRIMKTMIRALGVGIVRGAENAAQALDMIDANPPDILILDWMMQGMNGLELARHLRTSGDSPNPYLPIVMVSAHADRSLVIEARNVGINEFVVKPVSVAAMAQRLSAIVDRPRPFVRTANYFGPDRRRHSAKMPNQERRALSSDVVSREEIQRFIEARRANIDGNAA
jgi:two-component system, chemotaxis family, chemotaxis protein CheY